MRCEAFFLYFRIIEKILLRCQFELFGKCSSYWSGRKPLYFKISSKPFFPQHSFQSDDTTRKIMRNRHDVIDYQEASIRLIDVFEKRFSLIISIVLRLPFITFNYLKMWIHSNLSFLRLFVKELDLLGKIGERIV
jgi:hypothetical protein